MSSKTPRERRQLHCFLWEKSIMPVGGGAESGGKPDKAGGGITLVLLRFFKCGILETVQVRRTCLVPSNRGLSDSFAVR